MGYLKLSVSVSLAGALAACGNSASTPSPTAIESEAPTPDLSECILKVIELDEGRSEYTGTIARVDGGVRTYVTTSIHSSNGDGTWTNKSFGGDVGGTEDDAEVSVVTVEGNFVIPIENGKLNREAAVEITACDGPDPEGRYEVKKSYKIPVEGGSFDYATNVSWYGERGSYYAEDLRDPDGRIIARRSGVYLPVHE